VAEVKAIKEKYKSKRLHGNINVNTIVEEQRMGFLN